MKKIFLLVPVLFFALCAGMISAAQVPPQISVSADKTQVHVGDDIGVAVSVSVPQDYELASEDVHKNTLGRFQVRGLKTSEYQDKEKKITVWKYLLTITCYETGKIEFPGLEFMWRVKGGGEWQKLSSKPLTINVESVLSKGASKDIQPLKPKLKLWIKPLLIFLLVLALIIAGLLWFFKFRKAIRNNTPVRETRVPAHIIAYTQLEDIEKDRLIERSLFEEFFNRLSFCLRHYIENRFLLRAPLMSTEEFLERAKKFPELNPEQKGLLEEFLMLSDLVKFARYGSSSREANDSLRAVKDFVEQTKEEPLPEPDKTKKGKTDDF